MKLPKARIENIVMQDSGKELLIYDLNNNKFHNLNETSNIVYQACDGKTTFDDLKARHPQITDDIINLAIFELNKENLLENAADLGLSRRKMMQKVAMTAMALPIITGIIAPKAVNAQSTAACTPSGQPCNLGNPGACCSLTCMNQPGGAVCA